ncbi:MAG: GntR family transcriptional regulator [Actinobacteria bacterium]|nr:GntR family transcriptional regulator [Actinomycetota bacterium]
MVMVIDTPIDRSSDRPAYKQIADRLRELIDSGRVRPGDRLPSESELMSETGVSRATARRGLGLLINEGRAVARTGEGVFATGQPKRLVNRDPARTLTDFREMVGAHQLQGPNAPAARNQGFDYDVTLRTLEEAPVGPDIAKHLGVDEGTIVFVRRRLVRLRPTGSELAFRPAKLADSYIPLEIARGRIRDERTGPGGLYARIEEQGHALTHFREELVFRMPGPRESHLLRLGQGVPVIQHTRIAFSGERPVECFRAVLAGDLHEFEYRIDAE